MGWLQNLRFSDVFRGYRSGTLVENESDFTSCSCQPLQKESPKWWQKLELWHNGTAGVLQSSNLQIGTLLTWSENRQVFFKTTIFFSFRKKRNGVYFCKLKNLWMGFVESG